MALGYLAEIDEIIETGDRIAVKQLVRQWVERIILIPDELRVEIIYRIPNDILKTTDPGQSWSEVCGYRCGSAGGILHVLLHLKPWLHDQWWLEVKGRHQTC